MKGDKRLIVEFPERRLDQIQIETFEMGQVGNLHVLIWQALIASIHHVVNSSSHM